MHNSKTDEAPASGRLRNAIHCAMLLAAGALLYLVINAGLVDYIVSGVATRSPLKSAGLGAYFALGFIGLFFGISLLPHLARRLILVGMVLSLTVNAALWMISGMVVTRPVLVWLVSELSNFENAMTEFWPKIGLALVGSSLAVGWLIAVQSRFHAALGSLIDRTTHRRLRVAGAALLVAITLASVIWPQTRAHAESNTYTYGLTALFETAPPPGVPADAPAAGVAAEKIVLVYDESIRPDVYRDEVLRQHGDKLVSLGTGYSTANCSAASNAFMRWGVLPAHVGAAHDPRANASLWSYAHKAGFRTTLIDGQMRTTTQNFIRPAELKEIDEYRPMDSGVDTDVHIAEELQRRLRLPGREFIYIVKRGAHFPYRDNLPPALRKDGATRIEDYVAAVRYSTGRFFDTLLASTDALDRAVVFYTSDHGQAFDGGAVHCRGDYAADSYRVPIAVLGGSSDFVASMSRARDCWRDRASHQNIRSSIIEAFGYAKARIEQDGFPSLTSCSTATDAPKFMGTLPFPTRAGEVLPMALVAVPMRDR